MSDTGQRVPERAIVYADCPGGDCGWEGPIMADVSTTHARECRMACPRCGQVFDVRAELDLEVTAVNTNTRRKAAAVRKQQKGARYDTEGQEPGDRQGRGRT